ncbi:MAG: ABC transporter ATP-binding protein, partial [Clostridiales Family XIII bacterium]|nr:ABC transporter ATP-binding protein [Clostridiales Family XIII bacterium]
DEALSVGDVAFKEKCVKRVNEIIEQDHVTLLFVTHATGVAKEFCKRGIVMRKGKVICDSDIDAAIEAYDRLNK